MNVLVVVRIFPQVAPVPHAVTVIPSAERIPNVPPADKVNKLPVTVVPAAAICNVEPLFTVKFIVFVTAPPDE